MLQSFILYSKNDYRYSEFLSSFSFTSSNNAPFCLSLCLALNRAKGRHLITGIFNGIAYLSKSFATDRILQSNSDYYYLMDSFVQSFDIYASNQTFYLESNTDYRESYCEGEYDVGRMLFDLTRKLSPTYEEDKEEN